MSVPEVIGVVLFLEFLGQKLQKRYNPLVLLAMFVISDFYGTGTGHGSDSIKGHLGNCYEKVAGAFCHSSKQHCMQPLNARQTCLTYMQGCQLGKFNH